MNACIPVAATLTGKSVVGEHHPAYLGVYEGAMGPDFTREWVEIDGICGTVGAALGQLIEKFWPWQTP